MTENKKLNEMYGKDMTYKIDIDNVLLSEGEGTRTRAIRIVALENLYKDLATSQEGLEKAEEENNDFEKFIHNNVFFGLITILIEDLFEKNEIQKATFIKFDKYTGMLEFESKYPLTKKDKKN